MLPGDRLVCAFVKPQVVGTGFTDWPLHVTIVPWFRAELSTEDLSRELAETYEGIEPFVARVGQEAMFGADHSRPVNLIETKAPFADLEIRTRRMLHDHAAWLVDETTKRRWPYRPHVTAQASGRLQEGQTFGCTRVYVVAQQGASKLVAAEVQLGDG